MRKNAGSATKPRGVYVICTKIHSKAQFRLRYDTDMGDLPIRGVDLVSDTGRDHTFASRHHLGL